MGSGRFDRSSLENAPVNTYGPTRHTKTTGGVNAVVLLIWEAYVGVIQNITIIEAHWFVRLSAYFCFCCCYLLYELPFFPVVVTGKCEIILILSPLLTWFSAESHWGVGEGAKSVTQIISGIRRHS